LGEKFALRELKKHFYKLPNLKSSMTIEAPFQPAYRFGLKKGRLKV
jgi:hypothetical protein